MRSIASLLLGLLAVLTVSASNAQDYPSRTVRLIAPFAPGGIADIAGRVIGNKLSEMWKQQVIVENRSGGGGLIGTQAVAMAAPDGYTLLIGVASQFAIVHHFYAKYPLNPLKDFAPITLLTDTPLMFAASAKMPFNNIREMIAYANSQPGGLAFSTPGNATLNHLTGERFALETGIKLLHVPYKGGGPAGAAIAGGEVPIGVVAASSAISFIKSGRVKAIAVTTARRIALGPDWPTVAESGVPGFEASNWTALAAPAGTPREIIAKISADTNRVLKMPEVRERLATVGSVVLGSTPEELGALIRDESARYATLARRLNLKLD
ncbi:MAG: tripartite tricarboxylate transporter substrate binding protein [Betaproteobacteria bacterium]|nr:tripartite tricarboxylate transporter substrate binding protein [Betaproteobacteria bacterium]